MTDYKKMYLVLCGCIAKALDKLEGRDEFMELFLQMKDAMNEAEDIYIETSDDEQDTAE